MKIESYQGQEYWTVETESDSQRYTKSLCDRLGIEFVNDPSLVLRAIDEKIDRLKEATHAG